MRLTSLELLGFKSFLNRTLFRFDEGVTCIVGPNGCGKSNIVDAITWVLGERGTKSLRVKEMGDVIFHGSDSRKQVNMAEVTMGLMKDETEYAIRRRIYRDGTNEYYLNGDLVRLKDIQDFLLGTGIGLHSYAIIEQGNIEYFTQMKPHERRMVVEETSGITRFEEKKRDAFARLEEVKASLERVEDIEREVAGTLSKVEEEAERLRIYNGLRERLKDIDVAILLDSHQRLLRKEEKLREREDALLKELETKEGQWKVTGERLTAKEDEIALIDEASRKAELDIKEKEKDLEKMLMEITHLEGEKKRLRGEITGFDREIELLSGKTTRYLEDIEALRLNTSRDVSLLSAMEAQAVDLEKKRDEVRRVRETVEKESEIERNRLFSVMTRLTEIRNSVSERQRILREREVRRLRKVEEERLLKEKLVVLERSRVSIGLRLDAERGDRAILETEEKDLTERIDTMNQEILHLKAALEGLKGLKKGKEDILRQMKSFGAGQEKDSNETTRLINILTVSKETEAALERFFSQEIEYAVITERDPLRLAELVRRHKGDAVFFPPKGIFSISADGAMPMLKSATGLQDVFKRIAEGEEGIFLVDGVMVDSRGFIKKGRDRSALSISEFREKMKLESELTGLSGQIVTKFAKIDALSATLKDMEKSRYLTRENRKTKEASLNRLERESIEIATQLRTLRERLGDLSSRSDSPDPDTDEWSDEKVAADALTCEEEKIRIEQTLLDAKRKLEEAKQEFVAIDGDFHQMAIALERQRNVGKKNEEEAFRKAESVDAFQREKDEKERKKSKAGVELEMASAKTAQLESNYEALQNECTTGVTRYEELKGELASLHEGKVSLQRESQEIRSESEKARAKAEAVARDRVVLVEKRDVVAERLRTDHGIDNPNDHAVPIAAPDEDVREKILADISNLGEVNFRAEKERLELKERLGFLGGQRGDLLQAIESLKKTIAKIDLVSRELFLETFDKVNEAFQRFTRTLFKGGHGHLMLNQDTNGIELYVQPPGKKVIRMELLSGGEKALISLSFLLSLMDTKASPFTLMDEIDAPLDDANLASLLDIIKLVAGRTQVVLITHNRITMESSSTIYGITMEEAGISKTISIRL
jgi:chromosome segregation protein